MPVLDEYAFVLGGSNDEFGALSELSLERIKSAVNLYYAGAETGKDTKLIATGGYGSHFNKTARPHRDYVNEELINLGIPITAIENSGFLSANTVEDAILIKDFISRYSISEVTVVTSAFHIDRCRVIFECVMPDCRFAFLAARNPSRMDSSTSSHERTAIAAIEAQGGVEYEGQLFPVK